MVFSASDSRCWSVFDGSRARLAVRNTVWTGGNRNLDAVDHLGGRDEGVEVELDVRELRGGLCRPGRYPRDLREDVQRSEGGGQRAGARQERPAG